jgi:hypothetical protein
MIWESSACKFIKGFSTMKRFERTLGFELIIVSAASRAYRLSWTHHYPIYLRQLVHAPLQISESNLRLSLNGGIPDQASWIQTPYMDMPPIHFILQTYLFAKSLSAC